MFTSSGRHLESSVLLNIIEFFLYEDTTRTLNELSFKPDGRIRLGKNIPVKK